MRYETKPRYIYLLVFGDRRVYVGQSIAPFKRIKHHRYPCGGWHEPFSAVIVGRVVGIEWDGVVYENAWRWLALQHGWMPICLGGGFYSEEWIRDEAKVVSENLSWPFITVL